MQPSNQLKGLVESYGNVYANRQQTEELKQIAETIINCVGVHMVENGYVESDVKEFFERSSIGKILDVFSEAFESEQVLQNVNESTGLYETHLRYIPGAMATRMKNESPEIVNRLASRLNEEDLQEFIKRLFNKGREKAREVKRGLQGAVTSTGQAINRGIDTAGSIATKIGRGAGQVAGNIGRGAGQVAGNIGRGAGQVASNVVKSAPGAIERGVKYTAGSALAGPLGGLAATQVPSVTGLLGGGRGRRGSGQGSGRTTPDPTASSRQPSVKQPITKPPAESDGTGPLRPRAGDERARPTIPPASTGSGSGGGGGRSGGGAGGGRSGSGSAATTRPSSGATAAPTQSTTSTATPTTKKRTFNPLMQHTFGYQTGQAPDQIAKRKAAASKAGADFGSAIKAGQRMKKESSELDLVVNHLFTEGYAETLDGALSMIEGMSDQFINSILEQVYMESAMVEFLIQSGEAESIEEANYIISEMDEENIELLAIEITEAWKRY